MRPDAPRANLAFLKNTALIFDDTRSAFVMYAVQGRTWAALKEKFKPVWEPHYLAYPGGLRLPRVLADVAALVAGGYRRIFVQR